MPADQGELVAARCGDRGQGGDRLHRAGRLRPPPGAEQDDDHGRPPRPGPAARPTAGRAGASRLKPSAYSSAAARRPGSALRGRCGGLGQRCGDRRRGQVGCREPQRVPGQVGAHRVARVVHRDDRQPGGQVLVDLARGDITARAQHEQQDVEPGVRRCGQGLAHRPLVADPGRGLLDQLERLGARGVEVAEVPVQTGLRPGQVGIALTGQPPAGQELGQRHLGGDGADVPEDEGSVRVVGPGQAGRVDGSRRAAGTGVVAIGHDVQRGGRTRVQLRVPGPDRLVDEPDLGGRTDQAALPGGRPAARPVQPVAGEDVQQPGIPVVQDVGDGCVLVQPPGGRERDVRVRGGQHQVDRVVRVHGPGGRLQGRAPGPVPALREPHQVGPGAHAPPGDRGPHPQPGVPAQVGLETGPAERDPDDADPRVDQLLQGVVDAGVADEDLPGHRENGHVPAVGGERVGHGERAIDTAGASGREAPGHQQEVWGTRCAHPGEGSRRLTWAASTTV